MTDFVFVLAGPKEGTKYIAKMLDLLPDVLAIHEPKSKEFPSDILRTLNNGDLSLVDYHWKKRKKLIQRRLCKKEYKVYIESDFRYLLAFSRFAIRDFKGVKVICMSREPYLVSRSLCRAGFFSAYLGWLFHPFDKYNLIHMSSRVLDDSLMKCIWHTFEVIERKKKFLVENPEIPVFHFDINRDRNLGSFNKLTEFLGLKTNDKLHKAIEKDRVINSWEGKPPYIKLSFDYVRAEVDRFLREAKI